MRKLLVTLIVASAAALVTAQATNTFEVASVKANKSANAAQFIRRLPGGRVTVANQPVRTLITYAYQLSGFQLVGGPAWLDSDRFDIVAKLESDGPDAPAPGERVQLAMRALLEDRFKLKIHRETRNLDIYALVLAKPGGGQPPGLKRSTTDCSVRNGVSRGGAPIGSPAPPGAPVCGIVGRPGSFRIGAVSMPQLATMLTGQTGRMVIDRTGLTGLWDFTLTYAREERGTPPAGGDVPTAPESNAPSVYTALQEQLGLKLESAKSPVEVMVIDSVEHPAED